MKQLHINDTFDFAPSSRTYTDNGFLRVKGRAARTGIQQYLASELGLESRDANDIVNVYRPADEVFNTDSISSYDNVDVTNDHPKQMVDASTYKSTSVGHVISASQDGDFVSVDMIIKDASTIKDVERGKVQLSAGYTAEYHEEPGVTDSGEKYDFVQRNIKINHVAICARARAGAQARLFDNHGVNTMNKVTLDAGRSIEIEDAAVAALVTDSIARLEQQVTDANAKTDKVEAERDTLKEQLDAATQATSDEAIAKRVADVATAQTQARKIAGDEFTCDSVDPLTIKRTALKAKRESIDWDAKSQDYVQSAWDMALEDADKAPAPKDQHALLSQDAAKDLNTQDSQQVSAYDAHKNSLSNAWKGE